MVAAATRIALGEKLRDMEYGTGLLPRVPYVVVKVPVFSFSKMRGVETILGPEMKSTGEVLGIDETFAGALLKGFIGAGVRLPRQRRPHPRFDLRRGEARVGPDHAASTPSSGTRWSRRRGRARVLGSRRDRRASASTK